MGSPDLKKKLKIFIKIFWLYILFSSKRNENFVMHYYEQEYEVAYVYYLIPKN